MGDVKRLSVGISLDQWGNADPAIFDDEYGNYVEWATVDQLLRDVRVLQAFVVAKEAIGKQAASDEEAFRLRLEYIKAQKDLDNSGALTRWGGGGR